MFGAKAVQSTALAYDTEHYIVEQETINMNWMRARNIAYAFENFCQKHLPWSRYMPTFVTQAIFQMLRNITIKLRDKNSYCNSNFS